jgi:hypothetical protein
MIMPLEIKKDEVINSMWAELQANMQGLMARRDQAKAIFGENEFSDQDFEGGILKKGTSKGTRGPIHDADEAAKALKAESEAEILNRTHTLETLLKTLHSVTDPRQLASLNTGMQQYGKPATWWQQLKDKRADVVAKQEELDRAMYSSDDSLNPWDHVPSKYFKDIDKSKGKQEQKAAARIKWINAARTALAVAERDTLATRNEFFDKVQTESFRHLIKAEENLAAANKTLATLHSTPAEIAQGQHLVGAQISSGATVLLLNLAANTRAALIDLMIEKKREEIAGLNQQQKDLAKQNDKTLILKHIRTPKAKITQAQVDTKSVIDALEKLKASELKANSQVIDAKLKGQIKNGLIADDIYRRLQGALSPANLPHAKPKTREQRQEHNTILADKARDYSAIIAEQVPVVINQLVTDENAAVKRAAGDAFVQSMATRDKKYRGERSRKVSHTDRAYVGESKAATAVVTAGGDNIVNMNVMLYAKDFSTESANNFPQALSYLYTELFIKRDDVGTIREVNDPKEGKYYIVQLKEKSESGEFTDRDLVNEKTFVLRSTDTPVTLITKNGKKVPKSISTLSEVLVAALASTNTKTFTTPNATSPRAQIVDDKSLRKPGSESVAAQTHDFLSKFAGARLQGQSNGVRVLMERLSSTAPAVAAAPVTQPRQASFRQPEQQPTAFVPPAAPIGQNSRPAAVEEEEEEKQQEGEIVQPRATAPAAQAPLTKSSSAKKSKKSAVALQKLDQNDSKLLAKGFRDFCKDKFFNDSTQYNTDDQRVKDLWAIVTRPNMIDALARFVKANRGNIDNEAIFFSAADLAFRFNKEKYVDGIDATHQEGYDYYAEGLNQRISRNAKDAARAKRSASPAVPAAAATSVIGQPKPPAAPVRVAPAKPATSAGGNNAFLGDIANFQGGLKKVQTNDRSAPSFDESTKQAQSAPPVPARTVPTPTSAATTTKRLPPAKPAATPKSVQVGIMQAPKRAFDGPDSFAAQRSATLVTAGGEFDASASTKDTAVPPPMPAPRKRAQLPPGTPPIPKPPVVEEATAQPAAATTVVDAAHQKYFTMLKSGLPDGAVLHKMNIDKLGNANAILDQLKAALPGANATGLDTGANAPIATAATSARQQAGGLLAGIADFDRSKLKSKPAASAEEGSEAPSSQSPENPMLAQIAARGAAVRIPENILQEEAKLQKEAANYLKRAEAGRKNAFVQRIANATSEGQEDKPIAEAIEKAYVIVDRERGSDEEKLAKLDSHLENLEKMLKDMKDDAGEDDEGFEAEPHDLQSNVEDARDLLVKYKDVLNKRINFKKGQSTRNKNML